MTRQLIKSNHGFGWSISGWEKNNKLITKVVYRYPDGSRNSILLDLNWASDNSKKMTDIIDELVILFTTPKYGKLAYFREPIFIIFNA